MLFCISATEDPVNPSATETGRMLHRGHGKLMRLINTVTYGGRHQELLFEQVSADGRIATRVENLGNGAFLSLIQAFATQTCRRRDMEQSHDCRIQSSRVT